MSPKFSIRNTHPAIGLHVVRLYSESLLVGVDGLGISLKPAIRFPQATVRLYVVWLYGNGLLPRCDRVDILSLILIYNGLHTMD